MAPPESGSQQIVGSSARSEISTLPWRRWRSQSFSVSKCSPRGVRDDFAGEQLLDESRPPVGALRGAAARAAHSRTCGRRARSAGAAPRVVAECPPSRFFFAQYSITRAGRGPLLYSEGDSKRSRSRRGSWAPACCRPPNRSPRKCCRWRASRSCSTWWRSWCPTGSSRCCSSPGAARPRSKIISTTTRNCSRR